jgi:hypothetical protein
MELTPDILGVIKAVLEVCAAGLAVYAVVWAIKKI